MPETCLTSPLLGDMLVLFVRVLRARAEPEQIGDERVAARMFAEKIQKPKPVSELVLERLRGDIVEGSFELGEKISEAHLSEVYGVTKAPIRAAIIRLETEGLVKVRPQAGTFVFLPDIGEVRALCELRIALEVEAAGLAMERNLLKLQAEFARICAEMQMLMDKGQNGKYLALDTTLHLTILEHASSPLLAATYREKVSSQFAALRTRFGLEETYNQASLAGHLEIRDALAQNDKAGVQALLRSHIGDTKRHYEKIL